MPNWGRPEIVDVDYLMRFVFDDNTAECDLVRQEIKKRLEIAHGHYEVDKFVNIFDERERLEDEVLEHKSTIEDLENQLEHKTTRNSEIKQRILALEKGVEALKHELH